jgi:cytochrome c nitrite reductase small subunit
MKRKKYLLIAGGVLIVFLIFMWGPSGFFYRTGEPDYCNTCHVVNPQFEAWFMTGLHRNIKCVDCHLPNDNIINYTIWKGIDGMKDLLMFHSGIYSEDIGISSHGKKVVRGNCLRCHEGMVSVINTEDMDCWSCHRKVNHRSPSISMADFK